VAYDSDGGKLGKPTAAERSYPAARELELLAVAQALQVLKRNLLGREAPRPWGGCVFQGVTWRVRLGPAD
jgi:hypothetical protein